MHPELISFSTPSFLHGLFPIQITIYAYGTLILVGVILAYSFLKKNAYNDFSLKSDPAQSLLLGLIVSAVIGGKLFMIFEDPKAYLTHPQLLISNSGFVFYGSLLMSIGFVFWFIKKHQLPTWKFFDLIAFVALIVHFFGRMGCFFAGCCHGVPTDMPWAVTFNDPASQASPLHTALHPTQLYSGILLGSLFLGLTYIKKRQSFSGQIFLLYLIGYSLGRSVIEEFRGDEARGFLLDDWYSNSQFISTIIILVALGVYYWRQRSITTSKNAR